MESDLRVLTILDLVMNTVYWFDWTTENQEKMFKMVCLSIRGGSHWRYILTNLPKNNSYTFEYS